VPTETLATIGVPKEDVKHIKALGEIESVGLEQLRETVSRSVINQFSIAGTPNQCRDHVERLMDEDVVHIGVLAFDNDENDVRGNLELFSKEVVDVIDHA
jgi:alkanesulfonate monooxygenase SsuD/methylene tetrahydromethanopterin reductase-like flavin-dependent oxidoreductase (luciferase family)